jgi:hypothetical protein
MAGKDTESGIAHSEFPDISGGLAGAEVTGGAGPRRGSAREENGN